VELANKTIIITGASSGIGAAAASLFASEGADVVLGARRGPELQAVVASIKSAGGRATFLAGDVRDTGYAARLVEHAVKTFGKLDGAFNNAGIVGDMTPVPEMSVENWTDVLAVNLTSAFLSAKAQIPAAAQAGRRFDRFYLVLRWLQQRGPAGNGGVRSLKGRTDRPGSITGRRACGRRHSRQRASAWRDHHPGGRRGKSRRLNFIAGLHPMKRMASPREIAQAAVFLLSDRASFMTGSPMTVDGGMSVRLS